MPRFAEDLGQAIAWLKRHHPGRAEQIAVLGHSVGAGAALLETSRNRDIAAVISIAAFAHPAEVTKRYLRRLRLHGLIERIAKTQRYRLTTAGLKTALFYSRIYQRLLRRGLSELNDSRTSDSSIVHLAFSRFQTTLDSYIAEKIAV